MAVSSAAVVFSACGRPRDGRVFIAMAQCCSVVDWQVLVLHAALLHLNKAQALEWAGICCP